MLDAHWQKTFRLLLGTLIFCSLFSSCTPPHVQFDLDLGVYKEDKDNLQIEISVYVPSVEQNYTCDGLAFGDISDLDLRAARIHHEIVQPRSADAARLPEMPRDGKKIVLVMAGALDQAKTPEFNLANALAVGCAEFDDIEADARIPLSLMPTLEVVPVDPEPRFFVAQQRQSSAALLQTVSFNEGGDVFERDGLLLELYGTRADGTRFIHPGRVHTRVWDAAGNITKKSFDAETESHILDVEIPIAGPAELEIYASFQKGAAAHRIQVLSTRVLLDTEDIGTSIPGFNDFRDTLQQSTWTDIGPRPGQNASSGLVFVMGRGAVRNERALTYGTPSLDAGEITALPQVDFSLNAGPEEGALQLLGFLQHPTQTNRIVLYVPPHREGTALVGGVLFESDGDTILEYELPDTTENGLRQLAIATGSVADVSPCPGIAGGPGWLQGLNLGTVQDVTGQLNYLMLLGRGPPPLASSDLLPGASSRLSGSVCVDDEEGLQHRLLFSVVEGAPLFERIVDLGSQGWLVDENGVIQGRPWLRLRTGNGRVTASIDDKNQIIFPEVHNDDMDFNAYLVKTTREACSEEAQDENARCFLGFDFQKQWFSLPLISDSIVRLHVLTGRFSDPETEQLLIAVEREFRPAQTYVELYWRSLTESDEQPTWARTLLSPRSAGDASWRASDLDRDGIDEVMLVDQSGEDGARRARVIAF